MELQAHGERCADDVDLCASAFLIFVVWVLGGVLGIGDEDGEMGSLAWGGANFEEVEGAGRHSDREMRR